MTAQSGTGLAEVEVVRDDLKLYAFQDELSKKAIEGYNCIIASPTGSGKTHVAMAIAKVFRIIKIADIIRIES